MYLLEGIGCEKQVIVLLFQYLHHDLPLLRVVLTDALELIYKLSPHLGETDIFGEVVRDIIGAGRRVFGFALPSEEVVVLSGEEPGGRVVPNVPAVIEDEMVLGACGQYAGEGFGVEAAVLIAADDIGGK